MIQKLQLNPAQQTGVILQAKNKVDIWGRGTGKSAGLGYKPDQSLHAQGTDFRDRANLRAITHPNTPLHV